MPHPETHTHFVCDQCGVEYLDIGNEQDTAQEMLVNYGKVIGADEMATVCDRCYRIIRLYRRA